MITIESLMEKVSHADEPAWCDQVFQYASNMGYDNVMLVLHTSHDAPFCLRNAYTHTNLPDAFIEDYDAERMGEIDPIVAHCLNKSTPIVWSADDFVSENQQALYRLNIRHDALSGVAFPFHGPNGEFGILNYATDSRRNAKFMQSVRQQLPELSCFRDFIMDKFLELMRRGYAITKGDIEITSRELECLKWCATGKSSWDIAHLMNCTEATVNYHFANIRRKFGASSRRMAVIKAIRMGFIHP